MELSDYLVHYDVLVLLKQVHDVIVSWQGGSAANVRLHHSSMEALLPPWARFWVWPNNAQPL